MNNNERSPTGLQVDEQAALDALDGSRALLHDLAEMFCEDAPQVMNELKDAVEADDSAAARRAVHSIKGLAATFYAKPTVEIAQRLELEAAGGHIEGLRDNGLSTLEHAIDQLIAELKCRVLTSNGNASNGNV
jgi:HPt (histidine-containing phosphotransfer) domain-containing protein